MLTMTPPPKPAPAPDAELASAQALAALTHFLDQLAAAQVPPLPPPVPDVPAFIGRGQPGCEDWLGQAMGALAGIGTPADFAKRIEAAQKQATQALARHFQSVEHAASVLRDRANVLINLGVRPAGFVVVADLPPVGTVGRVVTDIWEQPGQRFVPRHWVAHGIALNLVPPDHPVRVALAGIEPVKDRTFGPTLYAACAPFGQALRPYYAIGALKDLNDRLRANRLPED